MARNQGVDVARHEAMEEARRAAFPEAAAVKLYREYARGRQRNTLTRQAKKVLRNVVGNAFCENVCKRLLTVLCDRIHVLGFQVSDRQVEAFILDTWTRLWLPSLFTQIVWATWRDGNSAATLGWHNEKARPTVCREKWWNGTSGIWFAYGDTGEPEYAVKEWKESGRRRRTFYYPDKICRYVEGKTGWQWVEWKDDAGILQSGPQWWTHDKTESGKPLGIAAEHYARRVEPADGDEEIRDNARDAAYGVSFLDGGILGLQDAINDQHRNLWAASRFTAYQIPTISGVTEEIDKATNLPKKIEVEPGTALTSPNAEARFGHIPAGSIEELLKQLANLLRAISQTAAVPEHLIAGQWPSGAALMRAEMPLIDQAKKGASVLSPPFASLLHKCVVMSNAFNATDYNTDVPIVTLFEDPERFDPMTLTDLAVARAELIPLDEVWRLMGYDTKTRAKFKKQMQEEAGWRPASLAGADVQPLGEGN